MIDRMMDNRSFDSFDLRFLGLVFAILAIGVVSIHSVTHAQAGGIAPYYVKQLAGILMGCVAFVLMLVVDYHRIALLAYPLYAVVLIMLAFVLFEGRTSKGAQRWIALGPFSFQPSEFAKLVLILVLAHYYTKVPREGWMQRIVMPGLLVVPGLLLILKQPDLGSGLSFVAVYSAMLLMVGMRSQTMGVVLLFSLMLFPFAWEGLWGALHDYQRQRIMAFVDPDYDPGGKGYHALQSRIAIGSGELTGKGLYGGTQSQLKFLPEGHTDFVFAVYAEEWGFVGVLLLLVLLVLLIVLVIVVAGPTCLLLVLLVVFLVLVLVVGFLSLI